MLLLPDGVISSPLRDRGVIQAESPLDYHLFQVPIAERIAQIPTKAEDDDLVLKVSPAKQCWPLVLHLFTLPECYLTYLTRLRQIQKFL